MNRAEPANADPKNLTGLALRLELAFTLDKLLELSPTVAALADTHQLGLGFLTFEARQAQDAMTREERHERRKAQILGQPLGHGATAAPGNWPAIGVHVEIWSAAFQAVDRVMKSIGVYEAAVQIPADGGTAIQLLRILQPLIGEVTDEKVLHTVYADLSHAQQIAENLIGGNSRIPFDGKSAPAVPCPHCGGITLVGTFKDDELDQVQCGRDHHTGRPTSCICPDPLCGCKTRPIAYRHTWTRARGSKPDGLLALWKLVDHAKQHQKGPRP